MCNNYEPLNNQFYIDRSDRLEALLERFPVLYIEGAAKSGKTTAVRMLLERHPEIEYHLYDMGGMECPLISPSGWTIFENLPPRLSGDQVSFLVRFLDSVKGEARVILLSREKPPQELLRFLWDGKMELVMPETLLFSREEVRELARAQGCFYWADAVYEESGGWPGCVQVLLRLVAGRRRYEAGRDAVRELCASYEVAGYVEREILGSLNEEEKEIMRRASLCPWLNVRLCREVWGICGAEETLQDLRRKGLLNYDRERKTYSAAPLFRNVSKRWMECRAESSVDGMPDGAADEMLEISGRELRGAFWKTLAVWYERNGYVMETLRCLESSGSRSELLECAERHAAEIPYEELCRCSEIRWTDTEARSKYEFRSGAGELRNTDSGAELEIEAGEPWNTDSGAELEIEAGEPWNTDSDAELKTEIGNGDETPGRIYLRGTCAYIRGDFEELRKQMAVAKAQTGVIAEGVAESTGKRVSEEIPEGEEDRAGAVTEKNHDGVSSDADIMYEIYLNLAFVDPGISLEAWMEILRDAPEQQNQKYHLYHILGNSCTFLCGLRDLSGLFACSRKEVRRMADVWKEKLGEWEWLCYQLARADYYMMTARAEALLPEDLEMLENDAVFERLYSKASLDRNLEGQEPPSVKNSDPETQCFPSGGNRVLEIQGLPSGVNCASDLQRLSSAGNRNPERSLWRVRRREYLLAKLHLLYKYQRCLLGKVISGRISDADSGNKNDTVKTRQLEETEYVGYAQQANRLFYSLRECGSEYYRKITEGILAAFAPELVSPEELARWVHTDEAPYLEKIGEENYLLTYCRIRCLLYLNQDSYIRRNIGLLQDYLQKYGRTRFRTEVCFQQAVSDWRCMRHSEAQKGVISAFLLADTARYVEPFVSYKKDGLELLEAYDDWMFKNAPGGWHRKRPYNYGNVVRMPKEDYVAAVIRLARKAVRTDDENAKINTEDEAFPNPEKLTVMETVVLQSLAKGSSLDSIATDLGIKVTTVKTHTYNLYRKLGVKNRVQAITKGREMGIIH